MNLVQAYKANDGTLFENPVECVAYNNWIIFSLDYPTAHMFDSPHKKSYINGFKEGVKYGKFKFEPTKCL